MTPQLKKDTTVEVISLDPRQQVICKHLKFQFYAVWQTTFVLQGLFTDVQHNSTQTHI